MQGTGQGRRHCNKACLVQCGDEALVQVHETSEAIRHAVDQARQVREEFGIIYGVTQPIQSDGCRTGGLCKDDVQFAVYGMIN